MAVHQSKANSLATLGDVLYGRKTKSPIPEEEWAVLVRLIAAGDQRALRALYQRSSRPVFTLAVRLTRNRETAEEVTLDVFHDIWRRAGSYDAANGTVLGWIMNQARSRAIDRVRLEQRKKRVAPPDFAMTAELADEPHGLFDFGETSELLRAALTELSAQEREAIETAYFLDLTYAETAARLNQPLGTVKTRIRAALEKLRTVLGQS
jgi:RNA polymerase sigma-70 factor (ECF subfamily)